MTQRPRVVIIGGGFGGLQAAKAFRRAAVDVTLIDRRNYHLFQPLLYQVATGSLSPGQIAAPLRGILKRQKNTRVLLGDVTGVEPDAKRVTLASGSVFDYDALIVAVGSESSYYGHDTWQEFAPSLKSVEEATNVRQKIFYAFEIAERTTDLAQRHAWLTFVIVGAGATGVELAGAIAEIARQTLRDEFRAIRPEDARVILIDQAPRVLMALPEDLSTSAVRSLHKLGVEVRTEVTVRQIDRDGLDLEHGGQAERLASRTVLWAGGVKAPQFGRTLAERLHAETDRSGRIRVNGDLSVPGYPDVFVIGDFALSTGVDGKPLPGVAQVAMQQGDYVAKVICQKANGTAPLPPFQYLDKGQLAVIGRAAAVANIFGMHLSGFTAWFVWAFIHLMYLVQFQSRLLVFIQWAFEYLTFSRGARLITGAPVPETDSRQVSAPEAATKN